MLTILWLGIVLSRVSARVNRPNIVLFISDNLGWNDVDYHGSNQTPNINALAHSGLTLENHYATPLCAPSRAALMTGKYPTHTDVGHTSESSEEKLLPQHLKDLGYVTHLIGKWHLGSSMKDPLNVRFDNSIDSWIEEAGMFDHINTNGGSGDFDFPREYERADDKLEKSATEVYIAEAIKRIKNHDQSKPMFLMVANSAMQFDISDQIVDSQKQKNDAMLSELDRSVGEVFSALHESGILNNSIILFSTDNAVSSYPSRDFNSALWEGGVRGPAVLWSPLIVQEARAAKQKIHIADWLPTLVTAAGGDISALGSIDGIDQWAALSSASIRSDQYELHKGKNYNRSWGSWFDLSVREADSRIGRIVKALNLLPSDTENLEFSERDTNKYNDTSEVDDDIISPCSLNTDNKVLLNEGILLNGIGGQKFL